jgi:hypothetical protein
MVLLFTRAEEVRLKRELDVKALYAAVESKKGELKLSWRKLAEELELADHTVFTRMSRGQTPEIETVVALTDWLGLSVETFMHGDVGAPDSRRQTLEAISRYLHADEALAPESADALESIMRAAYDQLAQGRDVAVRAAAPARFAVE